MNLDRFGNTSAASIPLVLADMSERNMLVKGQKIVIAGFGGGLS
jgi:3-oxoacyl-[acyl-carrier-protein] synthase-3